MRGDDMTFLKRWYKEQAGVAAVEAALMFPTLVVMMVSLVDIGNGLLSNQHLINAAQTTADLVTRSANPSLEDRQNAILAGQVVMSPYPTNTYEYAIASYQFDNAGNADLVWQESSGGSLPSGMSGGLDGLGGPGEGVVVVRVSYTYEPFFTGFIIGPIEMSEVAYLRGRQSAVVGNPL